MCRGLARTSEVAPKDELLRRQQVLGLRRLDDRKPRRVDILDRGAHGRISVDAVGSRAPTSQRRTELGGGGTREGARERREQSHRPLLKHGGQGVAGGNWGRFEGRGKRSGMTVCLNYLQARRGRHRPSEVGQTLANQGEAIGPVGRKGARRRASRTRLLEAIGVYGP